MTQSILSTIGMFITKDVLVALGSILGLIFLDVTLGIFMALSKKEFDPRKLANFLETSIFPYVGSLVMLGIFSELQPQIKALFFASVAAATVKFIWDIKDKLFSVTGVKLPDEVANPPINNQVIPAQQVSPPVVDTPSAVKTPTDETSPNKQ